MAYFSRKTNINLLSLIGVLIICFVSYITYQQIKKLILANLWVTHTHEVIKIVDDILIQINFAESRQRGFLLTADMLYLQNFDHAVKGIDNNILKLKYITKDNPRQRERTQFLEALLRQRINLLNNVIQIAKEKKLQQVINIIKSNHGKFLSDLIIKTSTQMISEENKLLQERTSAVVDNAKKTTIVELLGSMLSMSLFLLCISLLNQQLKYRLRIEKKLSKSEENLTRLAYYDTLTGMPNRIWLINKINQLIENKIANKNFSFLLIDIDNFKHINDSLGYDAGDALLIIFAEMLKKTVRQDDISGHISGNKFAIVLTEINLIQDVTSIVKKLIAYSAEPILINHHKIFITISVGVSLYPNNGTDAKTLIKNAEIALYRAKELGKNNFQFCTTELVSEVKNRALLDFDLHQAVKKNEFILLYQPKMSLKTGKMSGLEVLIRWNKPNQGLIVPEKFISLAESNGLIVPIGEWMIKTACLQVKKWQTEGLPFLNIAINVSPQQLMISDFISAVKKILQEIDFDPALLEFEITENIFLDHSLNNIVTLKALKDMGIKVTIDDFGTGFSSLNYLRLFNIDKLKIDQAFVQEIVSIEQQLSIINTIIVMAHSLNIAVTAEGVETESQLNYLKQAHCDEIQGYLYSRPLAADKVHEFYTKNN